MRFTNTAILGRVVPKQSQWRRHLAVALSLASLIALSLAWARPNGIEMQPRERATVVLVIDISSVSYTHLDVYKRQAPDLPCGRCPVSGRHAACGDTKWVARPLPDGEAGGA